MPKGGGHEGAASHGGGGGGGAAVEKAKKAVESAFGLSEWVAHEVGPPIVALRSLFAGKGWLAGAMRGVAWAVGISFLKEMVQGVLAQLGGGH